MLAGAVVRLDNGRQETTGPDGRYRFLNVRGTVTVTVIARPSYVTETVEITVAEDGTLDFDLEHTGTPPYGGTVFITPRVIEPSDPTTLGSVTYSGRGQRSVYDRRPDAWITIDAYLFDVRYGGHEVEFRVNPEFGSEEAAQAEVETYAPALGQLPAVLLSATAQVTINGGNEPWGGGVLIHTDKGKSTFAAASWRKYLYMKPLTPRSIGSIATPPAGAQRRRPTASSYPTTPVTIQSARISQRAFSRTLPYGIGQSG